jgi:hypothetical protein
MFTSLVTEKFSANGLRVKRYTLRRLPAMTIPELEEKLAVDATPLVAFR